MRLLGRIVAVLWPVHWLWIFHPVWDRHCRLIRPHKWRDVVEHAQFLWKVGTGNPGCLNYLYDGSEIL